MEYFDDFFLLGDEFEIGLQFTSFIMYIKKLCNSNCFVDFTLYYYTRIAA